MTGTATPYPYAVEVDGHVRLRTHYLTDCRRWITTEMNGREPVSSIILVVNGVGRFDVPLERAS